MIETSDFFSKTVQHLARSLAHISDTPWEKVLRDKTMYIACIGVYTIDVFF